jgi:methylthioribose-1-phosphate isomerase
VKAIEYSRGTVRILDQTLLPNRERWLTLQTTAQLAEAIRRLRIRGAPALGIAGAYGVAQAAHRSTKQTARGVLADAERAGATLAATRPTAVNLSWAIERTLAAARALGTDDPDKIVDALSAEADAIRAEDAAACLAMARNAGRFIGRRATVLTHCNTGSLCTGGYGTALGAIRFAHESGKQIHVLATETRPLLQGARLTAWELDALRIAHELVGDSAAPALLARGEIDLVIVGADRIAANGDVANKIGTYSLALAARDAGVPFVVVAPASTVDLSTPSGDAIEVEERPAEEVTHVRGVAIAPSGTRARNPAFDVTPARLVSAIVTEHGVAVAPYRTGLARLVRPGRTGRPGRPGRTK